jgi:hypothetical protein
MDPKQIKQRISILKKVNIFSETDEEVLSAIAPRLDELEIQPDESVIFKGERGHAMYMMAITSFPISPTVWSSGNIR